jgi:anaerobic magnesium-protoporphyrin IX monomethyl ester cyclase
VAAADAGWVTMHGPKIEHKRRQGELNAAMACGGGTDQIADDSLSPAEILAAQREADAHRQAA